MSSLLSLPAATAAALGLLLAPPLTAAFALPPVPNERIGVVSKLSIPLTRPAEHLVRRGMDVADLKWIADEHARVSLKYGVASERDEAGRGKRMDRRGGGTGTAGLTVQSDGALWKGPLSIGGQDFSVVFDTGSSDLWVPGSSCSASACEGHQKYTPSESSQQLSGNFSINYGDGSSSSGPIYTDTVTVAGITVSNQSFSPVTTMASSFALSSFSPDGICGLGFPSLSGMDGQDTFFQTLIKKGSLSESVFGFSLAESGAQLTLGGVDSSKYTGEISYTPVTEESYWKISLGGISMNDEIAALKSMEAVIDTGTTIIYGPSADVETLWSSVNGSQEASAVLGSGYSGHYLYPCASPPKFSFSFGTQDFPIPSSALSLGRPSADSDQCIGAIAEMSGAAFGDAFLVGDAFLRGVYTVFDVGNSQVGFAATA